MPRVTVEGNPRSQPGFLTHLSPEIGAAATAFSTTAYRHCRLSLREMEGARYMTARINGCRTCQNWRAADDLQGYLAGKGQDTEVRALKDAVAPDAAFYDNVPEWRTAPGFSERERLAIELAQRMGEEPRGLEGDEAFWGRFKAAFSDEETVDAVLAITSWIALGRATHVLELDTVCPVVPEAA
ncbi:MAG TPA: carboxymuconolactone decarboxylase family protein [Novosphingobium sp.]|nr:carboxymuconolactone decarboxylase family protein [Novosphingobium sp.]